MYPSNPEVSLLSKLKTACCKKPYGSLATETQKGSSQFTLLKPVSYESNSSIPRVGAGHFPYQSEGLGAIDEESNAPKIKCEDTESVKSPLKMDVHSSQDCLIKAFCPGRKSR